jgi:cell division protein FtsB
MRHSKAIVAAGTLRTSAFGVRHAVIYSIIVAAIVWAGIAFVQEAWIGHKLSQQVSELRKQNTVLAAQNQGYKKDVQALTSGSADEEEARLNGYARPQERLYLVTSPPTPSPSPVASPSASPKTH